MSIVGSSFSLSRIRAVHTRRAACVCCAGLVVLMGLGVGACFAGLGPVGAREAEVRGAGADSVSPAPAREDGGALHRSGARAENGDSWESSIRLPDIVSRLQEILPESWEVSGIKHKQTPRRWEGSAEGILIRLENPSIVAYHPNGFEYHPFFKIWLCPTLWRGSMEDVRFLEESDWSVLLGQNHKMKVFYLSQGVNDWRDGPAVLREALDLTSLPITRSLRQRIEPEIMMKVFPKLAVTDNGHAGLLERVVGLEKEGPLAYVEYATATAPNGRNHDGHNGATHPNGGTNGQASLSRCAEPGVVWLMERENLSLANLIMLAYPEVQTVYLRRVCDEFASDRIINRPDEPSRQPVKLSESSE
jgi:hypothetical protein